MCVISSYIFTSCKEESPQQKHVDLVIEYSSTIKDFRHFVLFDLKKNSDESKSQEIFEKEIQPWITKFLIYDEKLNELDIDEISRDEYGKYKLSIPYDNDDNSYWLNYHYIKNIDKEIARACEKINYGNFDDLNSIKIDVKVDIPGIGTIEESIEDYDIELDEED
jgi:hypothetical protein